MPFRTLPARPEPDAARGPTPLPSESWLILPEQCGGCSCHSRSPFVSTILPNLDGRRRFLQYSAQFHWLGVPISHWQPTTFLRLDKPIGTTTQAVLVKTDAGQAVIKTLGNPEGPHVLACEWVGTQLAKWLGLPTFDTAIMTIAEDDEIPFLEGGCAAPGPAFAARYEQGFDWGGGTDELRGITNVPDVAKLVVFDTWTRNCDRYFPPRCNFSNVFLAHREAARSMTLVAMDHTHCFTCGRDLTARIAHVDCIREEKLYGLFPAFVPLVAQSDVANAVSTLSHFSREEASAALGQLSRDWLVPASAVEALEEFIFQRAVFVAEHIVEWLAPRCWPQGQLF